MTYQKKEKRKSKKEFVLWSNSVSPNKICSCYPRVKPYNYTHSFISYEFVLYNPLNQKARLLSYTDPL